MEISENTLQVNEFARRNRHLKIFSRPQLLKIYSLSTLRAIVAPLLKPLKTTAVSNAARVVSALWAKVAELLPVSPQRRLFFKSTAVALSGLLVMSIAPGASMTAASTNYSTDYIAAYAVPGNILVSDEDGYLVKINPQTNESNRIGLTDFAVHSVESGESLSSISSKYGVKVETIMWENGIANANSLKIGQTLLVPPVDGLSYKVASGDSIDKIAKKYSISSDAIIAQNGLESQTIAKGQALFLPGAKPIYQPTAIANSRGTSVARSGRTSVSANPSSAAPSVGKIFIFPTRGKITQGYKAGHYAYDIADRSMPAIWAAGSGTVVKASSGTYGGGYGNHVIIDHGNGVKTLYGHMDSLNVYEGQAVNQGDVLGIMGNTGRVYGVTGIHLHWEVIDNGVKQYPGNYY
ncbi:MAG: M23 family metallopeptidase [Patescibacteria group bacterium]